jgi:hypothetical protein
MHGAFISQVHRIYHLEVSVADAFLVQVLQSFEALDEVPPHHILVDIRFAAFVALYFTGKVTAATVLMR